MRNFQSSALVLYHLLWKEHIFKWQLEPIVCTCGGQSCHRSAFPFSLMLCAEKLISLMLMDFLVTWIRKCRDWLQCFYVSKKKERKERKKTWALRFHEITVFLSLVIGIVPIHRRIAGRTDNMSIMNKRLRNHRRLVRHARWFQTISQPTS